MQFAKPFLIAFRLPAILALLSLLFLANCAVKSGLPDLDVANQTPPTVTDIVNHVDCEIYTDIDNHTKPNADPKKTWAFLTSNNFIATISLTLQVQNTEGLNPTLSFITPLKVTPAGSFTFGVGGQLNGTQTRTFKLNYLVYLPELKKEYPKANHSCDDQNGFGLKGNLGLNEIITAGLDGLAATKAYLPPQQQKTTAGKEHTDSTAATTDDATEKLVAPLDTNINFSSIVEFNVVWGLNGGLNWSLSHFGGPGGSGGGSGGSSKGSSKASSGSGGSGNLLNFNRTTDDQMTVTFSPTCLPLGNPNGCNSQTIPTIANSAFLANQFYSLTNALSTLQN